MKLAIGLALLAVGAVLLAWGIASADSFASDVSQFFTGNPTDKAMWLTICGIAGIAAGIVLTALGSKRAIHD